MFLIMKIMDSIKYSSEKPLPNNFLAEQAILNIILTNPSTIKTVIPKIKIEAFYFKQHKLIYEVLLELSEKNRSINLTSVITILENKGFLNQIGGVDKIINIINRFESFLDLDDYIKLLNEKYLRRLTIELGKQIIGWGYTMSTEIEEIFEKTEHSIYNLTAQKQSEKVYKSREIIDDIFDEIKRKVRTNKTSSLLTSFTELDSILNGFQTSDLIVIAGRPSMGKTAFSLALGKNIVAKYKIPLVIFSLEMSRQQIIYRFLAADSGINSTLLTSGKLSTSDWSILSNSLKTISELPIYIDDDSNLTILEMRSKLRKILFDNQKNGFVIIDYLQLMKISNSSENRAQEISYITRNLKILAKEFKIPIIALSQLSRGVESRTNKRPMLSDLRDSGCVSLSKKIQISQTQIWTQKNILEVPEIQFQFKGIKPTFLIEFENNKKVILTSNHKVLTNQGWRKVIEFDASVSVYCVFLDTKHIDSFEYSFYRIKNIKYIGLNSVYDKTIKKYHNYIINNLILHNSIEQDADIVIMLYREDYYENKNPGNQITELIVSKHRNGPTGVAKVLFNPLLANFTNLGNAKNQI